MPALEALENRLAPATLVNPSKLTYQDVDGDNVTVTLSKPLLTAGMFTFNPAGVTGVNTTKQQLQTINLSSLTASGLALTITATRSATNGGDGRANVGFIDATGLDLGAVLVDGDLGRIIAGDGTVETTGLASLTTQSIGRFGITTQVGGNLDTVVTGRLGKLIVKGDVRDSFVDVIGTIGSINVTGSLIAVTTSANRGRIHASGNMGAVKVGRDIVGGDGLDSGGIDCGDSIIGGLLNGVFVGVSVGGSIIGGAGQRSGAIHTNDDMAKVTIGGNVQGGSGSNSGQARTSNGKIASVTVGGSIIGGSTANDGVVRAHGSIGPVKVAGDVIGGSGTRCGAIISEGGGNIASVRVGGSVRSGTGSLSGFITAGHTAGLGALGPVSIGGSLIGTSANPVIIAAVGQIDLPPSATTDVAIKSLTVGGRVEFANILAGYAFDLTPVNADAQIGAVLVKGDWIASNLVAGAVAGPDTEFGTNDDELISEGDGEEALITARISSITINGQVMGTVGGADHFGFVAQQIVKFKVGGTTIPLTAGLNNDNLVIGATNLPTGDVNILEVA